MTTPTISLIIPAYNAECYLAEAIDSALSQDDAPVEVVVVDDGSTDATPRILAGYGERLRVLTQPNRGVGAARNAGVAASSGDWLAFLDADDRLRPDKLSRQAAMLRDRPDVDLCDCYMVQFWSPELTQEQLQRDPRYAGDHCRKRLAGATPTWLFRRSLWERVGGFATDLKIGEDTDWFARVLGLPAVRYTIDADLVERRLHPGNTTAQTHGDRDDILAATMKAHLERMRRKASA